MPQQLSGYVILCDHAELQRRYDNHLRFLNILRASNIDDEQVKLWAKQIDMFFLERLPKQPHPSARL